MMKSVEAKFIFVFFASSAIFLIGIIVISIVIDPRGFFGTGKFTPLVMTSRPAKVSLLKKFTKNPDILILGGSNVFKIDPEKIKEETGLQAFNAAVNNPKAEDFLALTRYAVEDLRFLPRFIILGIHPESFDSNRINTQTVNIGELRSKLHISSRQYLANLWSILDENLTIQYLWDVGRTLYYIYHGYPQVKNNYRLDGYVLGEIFDGQTLDDHRRRDSRVVINNFKKDYKNNALSQARKEYLEEFLDFAQKENVAVAIMILPFEPTTLELLRGTPEFQNIFSELDGYLNTEKAKYNFEYYNFIDIRNFNGDPGDFSDVVHPGDKNSDLMVRVVLDDYLAKSSKNNRRPFSDN